MVEFRAIPSRFQTHANPGIFATSITDEPDDRQLLWNPWYIPDLTPSKKHVFTHTSSIPKPTQQQAIASPRQTCSNKTYTFPAGASTLTHALLALEDGTVFEGRAFGAQQQRVGEVVFNTALTGYQE